MDVTISGRHVDVTDAMREHARERIEKLERFSPHIMRARVTLAIEGDRHTAEIIVSIPRKGELVAKCETLDMYQSIDLATDKMETQLHKVEERARDRHSTGRDKWAESPPAEEPADEDEDELDIDEDYSEAPEEPR